MKNVLCFNLLSLLVILASCSGHSGHNDDVISPVITITSPTNEIILNNTQTLKIIGSITDDIGLHEAEIKISKGSTTLSTFKPEVLNLTDYQIRQDLSIAGVKSGDILTFRVEALDHNDNSALIDISLTVK